MKRLYFYWAEEKENWEAKYWRKSYEDLVKQTGRDLNDGLGLDPRKKRGFFKNV